MGLTIGADVEFFLNSRAQGIIPATAFNCPGSKLEPVTMGTMGTFHRDNLSVEIQPLPADTPADFVHNGNRLFQALKSRYRAMNLTLSVTPVAQFPAKMLKTLTEANEIGCEPDRCAYSGQEAKATDAETLGRVRTASGHIHIGGQDGLPEEQRAIAITWMDVLEGLWCRQHEDHNSVGGSLRRSYYGQAGRYRIKPYGMEWRTPSNLNWSYWVSDPSRAARLFASAYVATTLASRGMTIQSLTSPTMVTRLRQTIDSRSQALPIGRRISFWQELLSEQKDVTALVKQAGKLYGSPPGLYASRYR